MRAGTCSKKASIPPSPLVPPPKCSVSGNGSRLRDACKISDESPSSVSIRHPRLPKPSTFRQKKLKQRQFRQDNGGGNIYNLVNFF